MMILTGQAGDGKTMLLGKFVLTIEVKFQKTFLSIYFNIYIKQEKINDKFLLFYHFLDGAFHPGPRSFMYMSLVQKLDKYLGRYDEEK